MLSNTQFSFRLAHHLRLFLSDELDEKAGGAGVPVAILGRRALPGSFFEP
jgi:hypothetical protein